MYFILFYFSEAVSIFFSLLCLGNWSDLGLILSKIGFALSLNQLFQSEFGIWIHIFTMNFINLDPDFIKKFEIDQKWSKKINKVNTVTRRNPDVWISALLDLVRFSNVRFSDVRSKTGRYIRFSDVRFQCFIWTGRPVFGR